MQAHSFARRLHCSNIIEGSSGLAPAEGPRYKPLARMVRVERGGRISMGFIACGVGRVPDRRLVVDWEEPRCLLCNSNEGSILVEAADPLPGSGGLWFAVNQCQDCGL